jgi:predicted AAA+ superfamily ATPase
MNTPKKTNSLNRPDSFNYLKKTRLSLNGLIVYDAILRDKKIRDFCLLLDAATADRLDAVQTYQAYFRFYREMLGNGWRLHVLRCLLKSDNPFAAQASQGGFSSVSEAVKKGASRDLTILQKLADIKPAEVKHVIAARFSEELTGGETEIYRDENWPGNWPEWDVSLTGTNPEAGSKAAETESKGLSAQQWLQAQKEQVIGKFTGDSPWSDHLAALADYHCLAGCGIFADYAALRIKDDAAELEGVENPDPVRISHLFCQEREQAVVLKNTESFLRGCSANHVILYGSRGTGKSSLVKALLNEYADKGLRLIQLKKSQLGLYSRLVKQLALSSLRFIIFIDDLSFREEEDDYKSIKSLLEGGAEARPENVLLYATSNRRHFVKETFAERRADDVHASDNMDEKLSLADRFGITVTFLSPDQESYLRIVEGLARQSGLDIDRQLLRQKALQWAMMQNGRSGRTARQFIDHLRAETAAAK